MKGDVANLARVLLARLAVSAALASAASAFVYVGGSLGSLSEAALRTALQFMGGLGLAATALGASGIAAAAAAPALGARFFPSSAVASLAAGLLGFVLALASAAVGAFAAGLSV